MKIRSRTTCPLKASCAMSCCLLPGSIREGPSSYSVIHFCGLPDQTIADLGQGLEEEGTPYCLRCHFLCLDGRLDIPLQRAPLLDGATGSEEAHPWLQSHQDYLKALHRERKTRCSHAVRQGPAKMSRISLLHGGLQTAEVGCSLASTVDC